MAQHQKYVDKPSKQHDCQKEVLTISLKLSPGQNRSENRHELENLISSLIGESGSPAPGSPAASARSQSRPTSYASPSKATDTDDEAQLAGEQAQLPQQPKFIPSGQPQKLSFAPLTTVYEIKSDQVKKEVLTYSKGVQTNEYWTPDQPANDGVNGDRPGSKDRLATEQQQAREEELRQNIRHEIEEELVALRSAQPNDPVSSGATKTNFPARTLTEEELNAVTSSHDFLDFVERSSKVIERALDEEYDVLADYRQSLSGLDDEDADFRRGGRRLREVLQFYDDRWSKKRMISDVQFSPKHPELLLASYTKNSSAPYEPDGLVLVWNQHMHTRPEFVLQNTSDVLTARFSPFNPSLILGGSYSGQVLLWDTRVYSPHPVQKTPLTGGGHTHPVYSLNVVGTQNAHNVISASTDGLLCSWSIDMLSQPQETLQLSSPPPPTASTTATTPTLTTPALPSQRQSDELAPTTTSFPSSDPTYLLLGTESGNINLVHRYDRAGARAGVDTRVLYSGHAAPVMSLDFHKATGPVDLGDLALSAGVDWSVKLWRVRTPATASIAKGATEAVDVVSPVLDLGREDAVYDAKWSPTKPGVFACVDGAGSVEVWDLCIDSEVPVAKARPSARVMEGVQVEPRSLNRVAWGPDGRKVGVGGLDGVVSLFEVGGELGEGRGEEWGLVRKLVSRWESQGKRP